MQKFSGAVLIAVVILIMALAVHAQPLPHGIQGIVYMSDGITEVPWATNFSVNDTTSGFFIEGTTGAGPHSGWYSVSIDGATGDTVLLKAWNATHYGERTVILTGGDMTDINVLLTNLSTEQQHTSSPTQTASRSGTGSADGAALPEVTSTATPVSTTPTTPAATALSALTPVPITSTPEAASVLTPAATTAPPTPLSSPAPESKENIPGFEAYFAFFVLIVSFLLKEKRYC